MKKTIAGKEINVNEQGYLLELDQWSEAIGEAIAEEEGIKMEPEKWKVIYYIQEQYKAEVPLSIRKFKNNPVCNIKQFYRMFPGGPLKKASKIAGIPKPASCI